MDGLLHGLANNKSAKDVLIDTAIGGAVGGASAYALGGLAKLAGNAVVKLATTSTGKIVGNGISNLANSAVGKYTLGAINKINNNFIGKNILESTVETLISTTSTLVKGDKITTGKVATNFVSNLVTNTAYNSITPLFSAKKYDDINKLDIQTDVEGINANDVNVEETSDILKNAVFAQRSYNNTFSPEGINKYSRLTGLEIKTVDDLALALKNNIISPIDIPVDYIIRDRNTLILNTRTSQALIQAGIPVSEWNTFNQTGNEFFEDLLTGQLSKNKLTSAGIATVKLSGGINNEN